MSDIKQNNTAENNTVTTQRKDDNMSKQQDTLSKVSMSAEERLLRAIFGEDDNSADERTKKGDGIDPEGAEPHIAPNFCIKRMANILALIDPLAKKLLLKAMLIS